MKRLWLAGFFSILIIGCWGARADAASAVASATNGAAGWAPSFDNVQKAQSEALKYCQQVSNGLPCSITVSCGADGYGAVARSSNNVIGASCGQASAQAAENAAMQYAGYGAQILKEWDDKTSANALDDKLQTAAGKCDPAAVQILITQGANVNSRDSIFGSTPLMDAVTCKNKDAARQTAQLLLDKGADINAENKIIGGTPLILALSSKNGMAKFLIEKGADVNAKDSSGMTSLMYSPPEDLARLLIEKGADVNAKDNDGETALMMKADSGDTKAMCLLIGHGADTTVRDNSGNTALGLARKKGFTDIEKILAARNPVRACASYEKSFRAGGALELKLIDAVKKGNVAQVRKWLAKGASAKGRDKDGNSTLHWAAGKGRVAIARLLIAKGADVNARDGKQNTPLHWAAYYGQTLAAKLLIAKGADINAKNSTGKTPLIRAIMQKKIETAKLLIAKGSTINVKDDEGNSALTWAISSGNEALARMLIQKGADIHARDYAGTTELMQASMSGNANIVRLLLNMGANVNARDKNGETALMDVPGIGNSQANASAITKLLLENGADVNAKDNKNWTALDNAVYYNFPDIIRLLLQHGANAHDLDGMTLSGILGQMGPDQIKKRIDKAMAGAGAASQEELHFSYDYQSGPYVRRVEGTVADPRGLWDALAPLQPPAGAHGGYGMLGDDALLGQGPGYGLRQLGAVARRYITFTSLYVEQPEGFSYAGVQSGVFTSADALNDTTLGWVFFDLRPKFEADLKRILNIAP